MQQAVRNYVNDNLKFWILAIVGTIAILVLGGMGDADAKPVLRKTVDTVQFYQDTEARTWYMKYRNYVTDMEENFDDVKVAWHGTYSNQPLILISGNQGYTCQTDYQLFWFLANGEVRQAKDFGTCNAKVQSVTIEDGFVVIQFDTFRKRVPLQ